MHTLPPEPSLKRCRPATPKAVDTALKVADRRALLAWDAPTSKEMRSKTPKALLIKRRSGWKSLR